jgi:STE24 endopeptidase
VLAQPRSRADRIIDVALAVVVLGTVALLVVTGIAVPRQPVPRVTDADLAVDFTDDERARERAFRRRVRPLGLTAVALDVLVPTLLVASGVLASMLGAVAWPWWVRVALAVVLLRGTTRLSTLPLGVAVRRASLDVGLAAGTWRRWWRDVALSWLLGIALTTLTLIGWVGAMRVWPRAWWLPVAAAAALLVVLVSFLVPVVIEPLFARFEPMPDCDLRRDLLALAEVDRVTVGDVLIADASRRTTALNAYVSGLGRTRRVVVHDTLLDTGSPDEVRAVVAHELGHVVAHDVRTGTLLGAGGAVVTVALAAVLLGVNGVLARGHVPSTSDPAVVGLLVVGGAWLGLLTAPVQNMVSRRIERRADRHCLLRTGDAATVATMQRTLAVTNLAPLRPPRILHLWFGTHPTSPERIAAARAWAREHGLEVPAGLVTASKDAVD